METITDKSKSKTQANSYASFADEEPQWKEKAKEFAVNAALTIFSGAMFALGGAMTRSAIDRVRASRTPAQLPLADNPFSTKKQSANA